MAIKHKKLILAAFLSVLSFGAFAVSGGETVYADDDSGTSTPKIQLQISPVKTKLELSPGESYVSSIKVMNSGSEDFKYTMSVTPYSVIDENYSANYSAEKTYTQIANWVTFDKDKITGTLQAGSSVDVPFTIKVPTDVPAGGQYAAIMAETDSGESGTVSSINRLGMVLYARVSGQTRETGSIVSNTINSFLFEPPITVSSLVENTGNVEGTATYIMKVWGLFGGETVYNNEDHPATLDIIQDSRRYHSISWEGSPKLGLFWVEQTIQFLGKTSTEKKLVFLCPLWFLLIIIIIVVALAAWLISRIIARRNANKIEKEDN